MFNFKKVTSLFLVTMLLLTGVIGAVYAADNADVEEKIITEGEAVKTGEESGESSNTSSDELRNGNLTKDSKYPFYDEAKALSEETKNIILNINKNFEKEGAQIGVVVLNSLNGDNIEEKANKIFNTWDLGSKERNNGALLLVAITDRKFRLEVGEGLKDTVLSNNEAKEIINKMVPYFKKEAYNLGINVALFEIDQKFYAYRNYLTKETEEEDAKKISGVAAVDNNKSSNSSLDDYYSKIETWAYIAIVAGVLLFLLFFAIKVIIESISIKKEENRKAREEEEKVRQFGQKHSFNINIKDQHGETKTMEYCDYSRKKVNKEEILDDVKYYILSDKSFGSDITDYDIESISPSIDNAKCQDINNVEIIIKTVGEEAAFDNDKDRVKATKDFYNNLTKEERDFYKARATSNMQNDNGTNIWFYLYLYMLLKSDKKDNFRTSMSRANIASDRFYKAPEAEQNSSSGYNDNNNSSDAFDTLNTLNSLNSTFGGDNSNGSPFGGFGGGSSSGGGASGGW